MGTSNEWLYFILGTHSVHTFSPTYCYSLKYIAEYKQRNEFRKLNPDIISRM